MRKYLMMIVAFTILVAATFVPDSPDKRNAPSGEVDDIKNSLSWVKEHIDDKYEDVNNSDATASSFVGPVSSTAAYEPGEDLNPDNDFSLGIFRDDRTSPATLTNILRMYMYYNGSWYHSGSYIPYFTSVAAAGTGKPGQIICVVDDFYMWSQSSGAFTKVADSATAGVTSITAESGVAAANAINLTTGEHLTSSSTATGIFIAPSAIFMGTEYYDVPFAHLGNSNPPDIQYMGSTDIDGVTAFKYDSAVTETSYWDWTILPSVNITAPLTLTTVALIEDSPGVGNRQVCMIPRVVASDGEVDVSGGGAVDVNSWSPYSSGDPHSYLQTYTQYLDLSSFSANDPVQIYIYREPSTDGCSTSDDFSHDFSIIHWRLDWTKK